jgi:putative protease
MALKKKKAKNKVSLKKRPAAKKVTRKKLSVTRKKAPVRKKISGPAKPKEKVVGVITHYFPKVNAAVIKLKTGLGVGDTIKIKGHTTDFTQVISSLQIDHVPVNSAQKGQEVGLLVNSRVRQHDIVTKV